MLLTCWERLDALFFRKLVLRSHSLLIWIKRHLALDLGQHSGLGQVYRWCHVSSDRPSQKCRAHAEQCRAWSEVAHSQTTKQEFLKVAAQWEA